MSEFRVVPDRLLQGLGQPGHQNHLEIKNSSHLPICLSTHAQVQENPPQLQAKSVSETEQQLKEIPQPNFSESGGNVRGLPSKSWPWMGANASNIQQLQLRKLLLP